MLNTEDNYSGAYSSSYYVEDASFLRLKNLVLGYSLPKELLKKLVSRISACIYKPRISLRSPDIQLGPRVYQRLFTAKRF